MADPVEYVYDASSALKNVTASEENDTFDYGTLIQKLREAYIKDFYGEHFHSLFIVTLVVVIIGYVTNTLNIIVFLRTSLSNSMNLFLLLLSLSDMILITTQLAHVIHYLQGFTMYPYFGNYLFLMICTFFESVFDNVSNWMVAIVGIWRYTVITWPQRCSKWFERTRVNIIIIFVLIFSLLLAIPMFVVLTYQRLEYKGHVFYDQTLSEFAKSKSRLPLKIYWGFLLLRGLVPMVIMAITTCGLVLSLRRSNHNSKDTVSASLNTRITVMLVLLLILFLLSNLPDSFMFFISLVSDGNSDQQTKYRHATDVIRFFMLANNSFSFFIYYGLGLEFRRTFNGIFCRCSSTKNKDDSVVESSVENVEPENVDTAEVKVAHKMKVMSENAGANKENAS